MFVIPSSTNTGNAGKVGPLVPMNCYRVHCTAVNNAPSKSSGLPMSTLHCQILAPDSVTMPDGSVSRTAGIEGDLRFVFKDDKFAQIIDKIKKLGVTFADTYQNYDEAIVSIQAALAAQMVGMTFEMVISSQREAQNGVDGRPLKDSAGNEILGMERADFAWFNIQGIPLPITSPALVGTTRSAM